MTENKNSVMIIQNEKNEQMEVEVICTFSSEQTKKDYVIFTDYTTDESGAWVTYAYSYDKTGANKTLYPLETEEEWNTVDAILSKLTEKEEEQNHE